MRVVEATGTPTAIPKLLDSMYSVERIIDKWANVPVKGTSSIVFSDMDASEDQQDVWNELVDFIRNYTSISPEFSISRHTTIVADIGLDGDDADEFMVAYSKRFRVDAGDFRFPDYFGPEGFDLIGAVMDVIRRKPPLKPLTIGMLELAAKMGRWDTKTLDEAYSSDS